MPSDCKTVREVFEESQRGFQHHGKLIRCLKRIQNSFSSEEEFRECFLDHLRYAMIVFKREPAVERIAEFVAKYSTAKIYYEKAPEKGDNISDDEDDSDSEPTNPFLQFMFKFLLDCHDAKDKGVRFRSCQLINKLLNNMDDDASIDDDIADGILTSMLKRLKDKIPAIRIQAVYALSRLQDPRDDDCPVLSSYMQMMTTDSSADVRKAVLMNIALTRRSLTPVIGRTHDITEAVRKVAYRIIGEKVKIQSLSIALRVQLLQDGLNDRSSVIQEVCIKCILQGWLKSLDGNVVSLLKCLDIENSVDTAEIAVKALLKGMMKEDLQDQISSLKSDTNQSGPISIPYDQLDCETAFYWRCLGEHIKSLGVEGEDLLDLLLPEVSVFCQYVQGYTEKEYSSIPEINEGQAMPQTFVAQQLLLLMGVVDLSDEVGRKRLGQLIHDLLVSPFIPESLVEVLLSRNNEVQEEEEARIQELVEVIADVRQPIVMVESTLSQEEERKKELQLATIKVKLMELNDELENCVNNQDFSKAAELKQQITEIEESRNAINESSASVSMAVREEKDDPVTLLKCLTIACQMLQITTRNGLNPTLMTLIETLIIPGVQNEDPKVRNAAIKSLGLCALLSCEFARKHLVLFLQVAQLDLEMVQVTALQVVFDLLLKFGLEAFKLNPNKDFLEEEKLISEKEDKNNEEQEQEGGEQKEDGDVENSTPDNTATSVLTILTGLLESESNDLRNGAAEGLAKLLLSGRVLSAKLLSRLILLWYNPTTEEDGSLRHCIGVFLPVFAFASRTNQELVEDAFLPILKTLFSAPSSSPLASINSNNVAELLIELTNSKYLNKNNTTGQSTATEGCSHVSLALKVANEVLSDPQAPGTRVLCKVLTSLDLNGCDQTSIKDLKVLAYKLYDVVEESASTKLLDKFQKNLDHMDKTTDQDATNEQAVGEETTTEGSHDSSTQSQDTQPPNDQPTSEADHDHVPANQDQSKDLDNQDDTLSDSTNTLGNRENAHETVQKEKVISKTPKTKPSDRKKTTAAKTAKSMSTAKAGKRSRQKITSKSASTIKARLNLSSDSDSDIEIFDKENYVFQ
ncbi:condensin complex subunit 3-like [Actinia tenebrosa]|uniref:Condensin complex subunit 3-like n=1 Tax=Actinia tenebrosa TaxID=6105 RepID=A0A6P8IVS3_ACTTE|nr:condensin complex subunit 3-like [Actinia tenebrosa]